MSNPGGRGRGVSNAPAWMTRQGGDRDIPPRRRSPSPQDRDQYGRNIRGGPPPSSGRGPPPNLNGNFDRRGPPPGGPPPYNRGGGGGRPPPRGYGDRRGGGGPPPPRRRPNKGDIVFKSYEEELAWVEERRRKRFARPSKFDVRPTPEQAAADAAAKSMTNFAATDFSGLGNQADVSIQSQQTRHARRLYIGHLPADLNEDDIHGFFFQAIQDAAVQKIDEDPILSVYINHERRFCFLEFKTVEMTSACMALDGINIMGKGKVKIKRPNDYNPTLAPPVHPSSLPILDVSRLGIISGTVNDGPNKIFIGGLHYHLTEDQVLELLAAFGRVRAFHLVKEDADSATSKGYCFVEYMDPAATPVAVMGLNGMDLGGGKTLTARVAAQRQQAVAPSAVMPAAAATPSAPVPNQSGRIVVSGYDIEELVDAAMGLRPMPPPPDPITGIPPVMAGGAPAPTSAMPLVAGLPPMQQQHQHIMPPAAAPVAMAPTTAATYNPYAPAPTTAMAVPSASNALEIANAALEAAFGNGSANVAPAAPMPPIQQQPQMQQHQQLLPQHQQGPPATRILVLHNMVTDEDLSTEEEYRGLFEEVHAECSKFGDLVSMKVPRAQDGVEASAIKKIFLEYATANDAQSADKELSGRTFGPNVVQTSYFDERDYQAGRLR
mmetsp:Transcript_23442/g.32866  ORF Transcript_23442/g.32866 Transcript_23442/m.32866 type:complete len:662 (+) Transcript_23442:119-2104(+)